MSKNLENRCKLLSRLFADLMATDSRTDKEIIVNNFRNKWPQMTKDLDYCFEVLAGKHKLGYTYISSINSNKDMTLWHNIYRAYPIRQFVEKVLKPLSPTDFNIEYATIVTPPECRQFIATLVNREFRLGYSNKHNMITNLSPMLAKKYPETFKGDYCYYIQEKLDGNRCIAYYDNEQEKWCFQSRSGKPLKVDFDMSWANIEDIFDGEVMTLEHAGSRDFNRTSGAINSKFGDKSGLHYFIYDIVDETKMYKDRLIKLTDYDNKGVSKDCSILPVLDNITVYNNISYNWLLDEYLDKIVNKGGEGLILRDPNGYYEHKRSNNLLKYKKTQTMDLRIIDWNEGNGKYLGAIGSFLCETDDHSIRVNVSGMPDDIHYSNPEDWIGKIIEVAYFDISQSANNTFKSLRFPRLKRIRGDKNETSIY